MTLRRDGREPADLREIAFTRDFTEFAAGSVLVEFGRTRVLCTASVETRVPPWLRGSGRGWVTAEYSMLPGSTPDRPPMMSICGLQNVSLSPKLSVMALTQALFTSGPQNIIEPRTLPHSWIPMLPGQKSNSRAGFRPDSNRDSFKIDVVRSRVNV